METREIKNLSALTFIVVLLLVFKAGALVQYWQQTRHILLWLDANELRWQSWLGVNESQQNKPAAVDGILSEAGSRMRLASQLLLAGNSVLPKSEPVIIKEQVIVKEPVVVQAETSALNCVAQSETVASTSTVGDRTPTANPGDKSAIPNVDDQLTSAIDIKTESAANVISALPQLNLQPLPLLQQDKVLLIGDSMMQGVAPHIASSLRRKYKIDSLNLSTQNTGLTYPSYFDWPAHVDEALATEHYAAIVVFMGANDTWDMLQSGHYIKFNSDSWREQYSERIEHILKTAETKGTAVFWLSAPPMGREDLVSRMPVINELYQQQLAKHPNIARFVSTAETLTADGKTFSKFLELPGRGSVMVRSDDGVHFTTQGQKLLAKLVLDQFSFPEAKPKLTQNP